MMGTDQIQQHRIRWLGGICNKIVENASDDHSSYLWQEPFPIIHPTLMMIKYFSIVIPQPRSMIKIYYIRYGNPDLPSTQLEPHTGCYLGGVTDSKSWLLYSVYTYRFFKYKGCTLEAENWIPFSTCNTSDISKPHNIYSPMYFQVVYNSTTCP